MTRAILVFVAAAASTACASGGAYAPRPFPTAPRPEASAPAPPSVPTPAPPAIGAVGGRPASERELLSVSVLTTARSLTGTPYRLGGADPRGFDCSGFVQYVLARHAIPMPRTVAEQFGVGAEPGRIEPGDLVFFETIGNTASHVGIAVDEASFVHAPNSRGVVRIERFDTPYWASRFLGARRIF